jgi:hypothetical protein
MTALAYYGVILTHFFEKYYVSGTPLTADWTIANLLDATMSPSTSILEMMLGYNIFKTRKPLKLGSDAVLSFYKKRAQEWWLPILAMTGFILLYWGSYDKKTSVGFISVFLTFGGILAKTPAYPFWLGVVVIAADIFAPICWLLDTRARRKGTHLMILLWFSVIIVPSVPGLFSGPITDNLFVRDLGFFLFGGYYLAPIARHISTHTGQERWLRWVLGISMAIALSVPLYEHFSGSDPWYPYTLRNYSMPYVALYSSSLAISLFIFLERHTNWSKTIAKFLHFCFPAYLIHSWILECGIYWNFDIPVLGLLVKFAMVSFFIMGWAWLYRYVQFDLGVDRITLWEES